MNDRMNEEIAAFVSNCAKIKIIFALICVIFYLIFADFHANIRHIILSTF